MLTAKKSPKSSSGPGGSMWGPQLGENICMVDCVRGKDCSCTCARTGPGPGPARTTVKPRSRPPLRFSGLELEVCSGLRDLMARFGHFFRAGTSHVGTLAMKTEPLCSYNILNAAVERFQLCLRNISQGHFTVSAQIGS